MGELSTDASDVTLLMVFLDRFTSGCSVSSSEFTDTLSYSSSSSMTDALTDEEESLTLTSPPMPPPLPWRLFLFLSGLMNSAGFFPPPDEAVAIPVGGLMRAISGAASDIVGK